MNSIWKSTVHEQLGFERRPYETRYGVKVDLTEKQIIWNIDLTDIDNNWKSTLQNKNYLEVYLTKTDTVWKPTLLR